MNTNISALIAKLEHRACQCDAMIGWSCDIHAVAYELKTEIDKLYETPISK